MKGIARTNSSIPDMVSLSTEPETAAAQEEMGAIMQTGAAVASIIYASLTREILCLSVRGRITAPTVRQLK